MLPKDQEKLLHDIHSRVIEYLNDIEIKPNKTEKEIRSEIDLSITYSVLFFWNWVIPVCAPPWIASDHSFYC